VSRVAFIAASPGSWCLHRPMIEKSQRTEYRPGSAEQRIYFGGNFDIETLLKTTLFESVARDLFA
jgi:hypothetical protein